MGSYLIAIFVVWAPCLFYVCFDCIQSRWIWLTKVNSNPKKSVWSSLLRWWLEEPASWLWLDRGSKVMLSAMRGSEKVLRYSGEIMSVVSLEYPKLSNVRLWWVKLFFLISLLESASVWLTTKDVVAVSDWFWIGVSSEAFEPSLRRQVKAFLESLSFFAWAWRLRSPLRLDLDF